MRSVNSEYLIKSISEIIYLQNSGNTWRFGILQIIYEQLQHSVFRFLR